MILDLELWREEVGRVGLGGGGGDWEGEVGECGGEGGVGREGWGGRYREFKFTLTILWYSNSCRLLVALTVLNRIWGGREWCSRLTNVSCERDVAVQQE